MSYACKLVDLCTFFHLKPFKHKRLCCCYLVIITFCFWCDISIANSVVPIKHHSDSHGVSNTYPTDVFTLPSITLDNKTNSTQIPANQLILIKKITITGNTILSETTLSQLTKPYLNRKLSYTDLQKLRDELTAAYIQLGYISSGAILPDQNIINHTVQFHIVQGILNTINVNTEGRFPENYIRNRLQQTADPAVNVFALEQQLQLLQRDQRLKKIDAELVPGHEFGTSEIHVFLEEEKPYSLAIGANNSHSPTIGAESGFFSLYHGNVLGFADQLFADFTYTHGLWDVTAKYQIPLHHSGTSLDFHMQWAESEIIDNNFDDLDIESRSQTYGLTLKQTVFQSLKNHVELFLTAEYRKTNSFLLGSGFSFSEGPENGVSKIAVIRLGQDWIYNDNHQVFAAKISLSLGLDVLGATQNSGNTADGQFLHILGQFQWARKFDFIDSKLIIRTDFQFSDASLLGIEQFSVGGFGTVRGYRENLLVGDNGLVGSIEYRVPIWRSNSPDILIEVASFIDAGYSRNQDRPTKGPTTITSTGLGLLGSFSKHASFQFYWGHGFREVELFQESNPQDSGFHFSTQFRW